jgi:hypothetical protein
MSPRAERIPTPVLLAYVDGELSPDEAAAIDRVSVDSEAVRAQLVHLRALRRALQAPVSALESREVVLDRPAAGSSRAGVPSERLRALHSPRLMALGAAAMLLLGVGLARLFPGAVSPEPASPAGEFRAKAGALERSPSRWAGIQAFRLGASGRPERLRSSVHPGDGLLFAYTNLGDEPFQHLMVFCVDATRDVHWFYPAYEVASMNPTSIAIQPGQDVALAEVTWLDLPKGPLTIYAAFSRSPLDVQAVEAWLETNPAGGTGFAGASAMVTELVVNVE